MNNLLTVCLAFRTGHVAAAVDLSKFHNQVRLVPADVHMQRFLWRGMQKEKQSKTLAVMVNNFGLKPANCIAICALHKSAVVFINNYSAARQVIKAQIYISACATQHSVASKPQKWKKSKLCKSAPKYLEKFVSLSRFRIR